MPDPETPAVDSLELLRDHVNDLAAAFGREIGELREQWAKVTGGSAYRIEVVQAERTLITPADAILVRLPSEAFATYDGGDEAPAEVISRVLADVLGTRRVVVIEDAAQITIAPVPPDGFPLIGVEPGRPFAAVEAIGDGTFRPIYLDGATGPTGQPSIDGPTGG